VNYVEPLKNSRKKMITLVIICRHGLCKGEFSGDKLMININTNRLENYCKQVRRKAVRASADSLTDEKTQQR
jgi:hypothetical protein